MRHPPIVLSQMSHLTDRPRGFTFVRGTPLKNATVVPWAPKCWFLDPVVLPTLARAKRH